MNNEMTTDNMSNEEVIEVLKGLVFGSFDRTTRKERQALDFAIKALEQRPQGECEKCDFRKFSEKFVDGVVEVMNKNGITSFEQLSEILKGGAE